MNLLLLFIALELFAGILTFKFFEKAGKPSWSAFIPIYRTVIWLQIIERPWWWTILCYLPVVGNVMTIIIIFELLHVFNLRKLSYTIITILTGGLYLGYLNFTSEAKLVGRDIQDMRRYVSELVASLFFAVVAATVIRAYTFEAFTIPTPSMEKSLMVGDFLFVSKIHYGSRIPITPLSLPLVHNKIPFTSIQAYSELIQLPYWRFPKISEVKKGDPVVFNYPAEDIRPINMEGKVRPIDKREHYVKRCVGTPGDTIKILDGLVTANGKTIEMPDRANLQTSYYVETKGAPLNGKVLKSRFDINFFTAREQQQIGASGAALLVMEQPTTQEYGYIINIPEKQLEEFKQMANIVTVEPIIGRKTAQDYSDSLPANLMRLYQHPNLGHLKANYDLFPNPKPNNGSQYVYEWSRDNFGPLYLPKAGDKIELNKDNLYKYRRAITAYEGNTLEIKNKQVYINDEVATHYTFKQGYYWMMGDNRHASDDSRYWGFVPADHIVGKPVFIWMSYDKFGKGLKKLRFDRIFTTVNGGGPGRSYFWPFVVLVAIGSVVNRRIKKKKAEKAA